MRGTIHSVLEQLDVAKQRAMLQVDGHEISVTNLDKLLWPAAGRRKPISKRDLLRYLTRVSPWILPHLADRPIFATRFPNGVEGKSFYQKHWEDAPPFARKVSIYSSHNDRDSDYLICDSLSTLLWLGQMAALELHPWFSRVTREPDARAHGTRFHGSEEALDRSALNYPDFVVFDLDPYLYSGREARGAEPELNRRAFNRTRSLAMRIGEMLDRLGFSTWLKTSGRTGLHLYLPIVRDLDYDSAREVAEIIARHALQSFPQEVTIEWSVERRRGKDFLRLQPEHSREVIGRALLSPAPSRRHGGDPGDVGGAGADLSNRLHHPHRARSAGRAR